MRNYHWFPSLLLLSILLSMEGVRAKPLVSFGIGLHTQRPYQYPADTYYNNYYGSGSSGYYGANYRYPASSYPPPGAYPYYPAPYAPGNRYGALDVGIGALSLTPFLL